jgi:Uma2 family endonuclease
MATLTAPPLPTRDSPPRKRFTRAEYERLIDAGFFTDQRCELIDGDLIEKMGQKPPHALCIARLNVFLVRYFGDRVRCQLPLEMSLPDANLNLPEPDFAILRESFTCADRHPRGSDTDCVIEVADSTVAFDRKIKAVLYARAGVPEYWVADIPSRKIFVHRMPAAGSYSELTVAAEPESIAVAGVPEAVIAVSSIFSVIP